MNRCPITYEEIDKNAGYSVSGLHLLSRNLDDLQVFPYDMDEQIRLAKEMATRISIQGVQPKISARLDERQQSFKPVEIEGRASEESALPPNGKKRKLTWNDIVGYLGDRRLALTEKTLNSILSEVKTAAQLWPDVIAKSFLPPNYMASYGDIVQERYKRLFE